MGDMDLRFKEAIESALVLGDINRVYNLLSLKDQVLRLEKMGKRLFKKDVLEELALDDVSLARLELEMAYKRLYLESGALFLKRQREIEPFLGFLKMQEVEDKLVLKSILGTYQEEVLIKKGVVRGREDKAFLLVEDILDNLSFLGRKIKTAKGEEGVLWGVSLGLAFYIKDDLLRVEAAYKIEFSEDLDCLYLKEREQEEVLRRTKKMTKF